MPQNWVLKSYSSSYSILKAAQKLRGRRRARVRVRSMC
ncbi:hypothetical protein D1AOALGA4SA_3093 [Olavius algarvensis Delta 1 endosymbiont]|nr:hypothetical protein D1AOALGA4SA_3093 [Olavius algarvensis Delta 1 endosymbiont]